MRGTLYRCLVDGPALRVSTQRPYKRVCARLNHSWGLLSVNRIPESGEGLQSDSEITKPRRDPDDVQTLPSGSQLTSPKRAQVSGQAGALQGHHLKFSCDTFMIKLYMLCCSHCGGDE